MKNSEEFRQREFEASELWEKMRDNANSPNVLRVTLLNDKTIRFRVKRDDEGFIVDPVNTDYEAGWGEEPWDALMYCLIRNKFYGNS